MSNEDILKKFAAANALAKNSGGGGYSGARTGNQWGNVEYGENRVRLGGVFIMTGQHFVEKLMQSQFMRSKQQGADNKGKFSKSMTCLNWNIDQEKSVSDEYKCCAICDLRTAARKAEKDAKDSKTLTAEEKEKLMAQFSTISGESVPKTRYLWPAIMRADPNVTIEEENGAKRECIGWKVLNLPKEANEGIEKLLKQYPKLIDPDEGVDIIITKTKGKRTSYTVGFALNGINIAMTPLTDEEKAMEPLDMKRFVFNHPSPRQVFVALNESYQELTTSVTGKGAEDYPEEAPIKRERHDAVKTETKSEAADLSGEYAGEEAPAPTPPPVRAAAPKAPAPVAQPPKAAPPKTSAPKPPAPKPVAPPPAPKPVAPPPVPKPAAPEAAPASDVPTPACFGTCDRADPQCSECAVINECETKKNA